MSCGEDVAPGGVVSARSGSADADADAGGDSRPPVSSDGVRPRSTPSPGNHSAGLPPESSVVTEGVRTGKASDADGEVQFPPDGCLGDPMTAGVRSAVDRAGGSADRPSAAVAPGAAASGDPPLLTGGLLRLASRSVDWLTVTVTGQTVRDLLDWTRVGEPGYAVKGFARSEQRLCLAGTCWRRWEPSSQSKAFGTEYESWEWSGLSANLAAEFLATRECRPSRVDIAYDFECPASFRSDDLVPYYEAWTVGRRITLGNAGQGGVNSRYVGARGSERRICVYRKDLQNKVFADLVGHVLRIELRLRREKAQSWWQLWRRAPDGVRDSLAGQHGFAAAAWHIHDMTGLRVQDSMEEVPVLSLPDETDAAQQVFELIRQHGDHIAALHEAGVPVLDLATDHAARKRNRMQLARSRRRRAELSRLDPKVLTDLVRRLLGLGGQCDSGLQPAIAL